jgi:hypothetical protein
VPFDPIPADPNAADWKWVGPESNRRHMDFQSRENRHFGSMTTS